MRKLLNYLKIIQTVSNEERHKLGIKRLGRGRFEAHRINPYNPLSYITIVLVLIVGMLAFGIYGFWKETDTRNPFRWD